MQKKPLALGTIVLRHSGSKWRVGAVLLTGGERYYHLIDVNDESSVAMLPWFEVEPWAIVEPKAIPA